MRGYNIDSLCVGTTQDPEVSRMTVTVTGDEKVLSQIMKQLIKLVEVIDVEDLTPLEHVERELVLIRVATNSDSATRSEILETAGIFRARVTDLGHGSVTIEVSGNTGKVEAFIKMMRPYGILELVRTGKIAIARAGQAETAGS